MPFREILLNGLLVLACAFVVVLIVLMIAGTWVLLTDPETCTKWSGKFTSIITPPEIYNKVCKLCKNCEADPNNPDSDLCEECDECSKGAESFSIYPPTQGMKDIEQVQWNAPGNMELNNPNDPEMNNTHAKWPGHEGFYDAGTDERISMQDIVLGSALSDDVKQNHRNYISDTLTTQPIAGASHMGVKDNYNPVNKWWGLKRDALHQHRGAMSDARQVQSETREQVEDFAHRGNSYLL